MEMHHGDADGKSHTSKEEKGPQVVLIGDSHIGYMVHSSIWEQKFEPLHCLNLGVPGDCTEDVLKRIRKGELDHVKPKVIVLMVGTNNCNDTADKVTEGILSIVNLIREKQPSSHIIVMGLLPKGEKPNHYRDKDSATNERLAKELQGRPMTTFIKIDEREFMSDEGIISRNILYDSLHLTPDIGYQKLCEPLLKEIHNLLDTSTK